MKYTFTLTTALLCLFTYVSLAQNVGVGTVSPNQKLDVAGWIELGDQTEGTAGSEGAIRYNSTSKTIQYYDGSQWIDLISTTNNDDDWTVSGNDIYNANSGNVGVGIVSPAEKLHIAGSLRGNQSGAIRIQTPSGYTDVGAQNGSWSHFNTDRARYYFDKPIVVDGGAISSYDENLVIRADFDNASTTNQLYLTMTGRVGIGTASPSTKLHVVGGIRSTALSGSGNILVSADNSGNLSKKPYSGNANDVLTGDGNWTDAGSLTISGDNLGNHAATQDLDMNNNDVLDWASAESRTDATLPHLVLESTSSGDNWTSQGAYVSIGESGALGSASMHMTYRGDGLGFVGAGTVSNGEPRSYWRFRYNADEIMTPDNVYIGTGTGSGNDLYIADRVVDWDNTGYYLDINGVNRMNEIMGDDGGVTDPSFHFAGDDNTGFFQPADNQIGVTINGTERLRVDASGNVGINDGTPSYRLDVAGNIRATSNIHTDADFYGNIHVDDSRSVNSPPTTYNNEVAFDFKQRAAIGVGGSGTYSGLMTIAPWGDDSGDASHQLNFNEGGLFWRQGQPNAASWGAWDQLMTASNVNSFVNGDNLGNHTATTDLNLNGNILKSNGTGTNIDHIWYDDAAFGGAGGNWHFVADASSKTTGNARVTAGHIYTTGTSQLNYMAGDLTVAGADINVGPNGERIYADGDDMRFLSNSGYFDFRSADGSHGLIIRDYTGVTSDWTGVRHVNSGSNDRFEFSVANGGYGQGLVLMQNDRVGVGTTNPGYKLHVIGKIKSDGVTETSDRRLKKNIQPINNALESLLSINGVTYNWRTDEFPQYNLEEGQEIGVIAQEIMELFPEVVNVDEEGYYSVEYSHLVPILIEALKEQQEIINTQEGQIDNNKEDIEALQSQLSTIQQQLSKLLNNDVITTKK